MNTLKELQEEFERQGLDHTPPVASRPTGGQPPFDTGPVSRPHPRTFDRWRKKGLVFSESDPSTWPRRVIGGDGKSYSVVAHNRAPQRSEAYRYLIYARSHLRTAWRKASESGIYDTEITVLDQIINEAAGLRNACRDSRT